MSDYTDQVEKRNEELEAQLEKQILENEKLDVAIVFHQYCIYWMYSVGIQLSTKENFNLILKIEKERYSDNPTQEQIFKIIEDVINIKL